MIPWSPLARGRLTRPPETNTNRAETDVFGKTLYQGFDAADRGVIDLVGGSPRTGACRAPAWPWPGCCRSPA